MNAAQDAPLPTNDTHQRAAAKGSTIAETATAAAPLDAMVIRRLVLLAVVDKGRSQVWRRSPPDSQQQPQHRRTPQ